MGMTEKEQILMLKKQIKDLTEQVQTQKILIETLKTLPGMNMDIVEVKDDGTQIPKSSQAASGKNAFRKPRKGSSQNNS